MNSEHILEALGPIDEGYIEEAAPPEKPRKNRRWVKWGALAACLCVVVAVAIPFFDGGSRIQPWSEDFSPKDYFRRNDDISFSDGVTMQIESSKPAHDLPYEESRSFSDQRQTLEAEGVIPVMEEHPLFLSSGRYQGDGAFYSLTLEWQRRGELEDYSNLTVTVSPEKLLPDTDCILVVTDENGEVLTPQKTVTERDGVRIVSEGIEGQDMSISWQTDRGWYRVDGSWNDSYEDMAALLDWFWEHPIDVELFAMENGDVLTHGSRSEYPDAFAGYIPDFAALGYLEGQTTVSLKNGVPYDFEGHYVMGASQEDVSASTFDYETSTEIHWCVDAVPDYYDRQEIMGSLEDLTEELVTQKVEADRNVAFLWDGRFVKVYTAGINQSQEAWRVISSLQ